MRPGDVRNQCHGVVARLKDMANERNERTQRRLAVFGLLQRKGADIEAHGIPLAPSIRQRQFLISQRERRIAPPNHRQADRFHRFLGDALAGDDQVIRPKILERHAAEQIRLDGAAPEHQRLFPAPEASVDHLQMLLMVIAIRIAADGQAYVAAPAQVDRRAVFAGDLVFTLLPEAEGDGVDDPADAQRRNLAGDDALKALKPRRAVAFRLIGAQGELRPAGKQRRRRPDNRLAAVVSAAAVVIEHDSLHRLIPHLFPVIFSMTRIR